ARGAPSCIREAFTTRVLALPLRSRWPARRSVPRLPEEAHSMFVFKAAVVGAGTMGGQIAQTIAAAGIPVLLKDIDDALVQAGLQEARNVTQGQVARLVERGKISEQD